RVQEYVKLKWCKRTRLESPTGEIQALCAGGSRVRDGVVSSCPRVRVILRYSACGYLSGAGGCTSRLVGRRDPLGAVPWPVVEAVPERRFGGVAVARTRGDLNGCPTVAKHWEGTAQKAASDARSQSYARTGPYPVSGASASGTRPTRLETRTKESNMYASHWALRNLKAK
ncbi:hypothetical protein PIB30_109390, partial [Stylosanthes scabra]|nr:hypothetical protein [Stylosanthes scabra]